MNLAPEIWDAFEALSALDGELEAAGSLAQSFSKNVGAAAGVLTDAMKGLKSDALDATKSGVEELELKWIGFIHNAMSAQEGLSGLKGAFDSSGLTAFGEAAWGVGEKLFEVGKKALELGGQVESGVTAFTMLTGSAEQAKTLMSGLMDLAATSSFDLPGLTDTAQKLLTVGFNANTIIPVITGVGNAVAALGGKKETLDTLTGAITDMASKGKASTEAIDEIAATGLPAWQMLADKIKVSVPEAMDLAAKGMIPASTAIEGIVNGMNQKFPTMMAQQSQGLLDSWGNLTESIDGLLARIGMSFASTFSGLSGPIDAVTQAMLGIGKTIESVGLVGLMERIFSPVVLSAITGIAAAVGSYLIPLLGPAMAGALTTAATAFGAAVVAAGPFLALGAAVGVMVYAIIHYWDTLSGMVQKSWGWMADTARGFWETVKSVFSSIAGGVTKVITDVATFFGKGWKSVVDGAFWLYDQVSSAFSGVGPVVQGVVNYVIDTFRPLFKLLPADMQSAMTHVGGHMAAFPKLAATHMVEFKDTIGRGAGQAVAEAQAAFGKLATGVGGTVRSGAAAAEAALRSTAKDMVARVHDAGTVWVEYRDGIIGNVAAANAGAQPHLVNLKGQVQGVGSATHEAGKKTAEAAATVQKSMQTASGAATGLNGALGDTSGALSAQGALSGLQTSVQNFIGDASALPETFGSFPQTLAETATAATDVKPPLDAAKDSTQGAGEAAKTAAENFKAFREFCEGLTGPLGKMNDGLKKSTDYLGIPVDPKIFESTGKALEFAGALQDVGEAAIGVGTWFSEKAIPGAQKFGDWLNGDGSKSLLQMGTNMGQFITGAGSGFIGFLTNTLLPGLGSMALAIWNGAIPALAGFGTTLSAAIWPVTAIAAAIAGIIIIGELLIENWDAVCAALLPIWQTIQTAAMTVFGLIHDTVVGIAQAMVAAFVAVWQGVMAVLQPIWDGILLGVGAIQTVLVGTWQAIAAVLGPIWDGISAAGAAAFGALSTVLGELAMGLAPIWDGVMVVIKGGVNILIGLVNTLIRGLNRISFTVPSWVPGVGGYHFSPGLRELPYLANGGLTTGPAVAMIGEGRHQEAVLPLSKDVFGRIGQGIADAGGRGGGGRAVVLNVSYTGSGKWTREDADALGALLVGRLKRAGVR